MRNPEHVLRARMMLPLPMADDRFLDHRDLRAFAGDRGRARRIIARVEVTSQGSRWSITQ
jgi:hypothetical protein